MADTLNVRQQRFVGEYLLDGNATRAYVAAGYAENGAAGAASRLLANVKVAAALDGARDVKTDRVRKTLLVTEAMVIQGLLDIATAKKTPKNVQRQAWVDLGRHLGMFVQRFSFTADQLDRAAAEVADEYGLEGHESEIAAEAERILDQARRDAR